jgi:hypothetical protein
MKGLFAPYIVARYLSNNATICPTKPKLLNMIYRVTPAGGMREFVSMLSATPTVKFTVNDPRVVELGQSTHSSKT